MGAKHSTSDHQRESSRDTWHKHVNEVKNRHVEINEIICLPQTNLNHENKRQIELFFKTFLRCMFYEQVTDDLLYKRVCTHVDDLMFVNPSISIDKNANIVKIYNGLRCKLIIYSACLILYDT
jgi:nucleoside-specific outer membrane channel protein Tsx